MKAVVGLSSSLASPKSAIFISPSLSTLIADIALNGTVNLEDYSMLASQWLDDNCNTTANCQGVDLNLDNVIDVRDLAYLTGFWLETVQP